MIEEQEIVYKAALLKLSLQKRAKYIGELACGLGKASAGLAPDLKPDRIETMEASLSRAQGKQAREGLIYATLRWALGGSKEIDDENLDL